MWATGWAPITAQGGGPSLERWRWATWPARFSGTRGAVQCGEQASEAHGHTEAVELGPGPGVQPAILGIERRPLDVAGDLEQEEERSVAWVRRHTPGGSRDPCHSWQTADAHCTARVFGRYENRFWPRPQHKAKLKFRKSVNRLRSLQYLQIQ